MTLLWLMTVLRLSAGILAVQDPSAPVDAKKAQQYAIAALRASDAYHVDAWELVGVARNESRFRADEIGPDGKDCGIMQTRITVSRYSCLKLRRDVNIAFMEGARELAGYSASCRAHSDFDRCRFNRYNSGIRYAKSGVHGRYYLRVLCFTNAARKGLPGDRCIDARPERPQLFADARMP
jgi:hypothetical protein